MIRVNLLEPAGAPPARGARLDAAGRQALLAFLVILATLAGIGWRYVHLSHAQAALDSEIAALQAEESRLAPVLAQVTAFEARKADIERRVALIDELGQEQSSSVHLVDEISRALPDGLWLTRIRQDGAEVTIEGECASLTELSDFVGNLEGSAFFLRPVEILDSAVVAARDTLPDVIHFSVRGRFRPGGSGEGTDG